MPGGYQTFSWILPTVTVTASGNFSIPFLPLPILMNGRIPHVHSLQLENAFTPTFDGGGAENVWEDNNFITQVLLNIAGQSPINLTYNQIRFLERLQLGRNCVADHDTDTADGTARYFTRSLFFGFPGAAGWPTDYLMPCAALHDSQLNLSSGSAADMGVASYASGSIVPIARLVYLDELRIPPAVEQLSQAINGKDNTVRGRALYGVVGLHKVATAYGSFAVGDISDVSLYNSSGLYFNATPSYALGNAFNADFHNGDLGGVSGELRAASADNMKMVNHASPTAIVANATDSLPLVWNPPAGKLSKMLLTETDLRITHPGSATTGNIRMKRILPQGGPQVSAFINRVLGILKTVPLGKMRIKTLSKKDYKGPYGEFFPWVMSTH